MRQWGSSLHHNGMSFFMASVPAGTQFYHGNSKPGEVTGPEWLAFEPEHAMVFARPRHRGHPPPPPPPGSGMDSNGGQMPLMPPPPPGSEPRPGPELPINKDQDDEENEGKTGYLHTLTASRDLRLLYLDGMSAAKTTNGTLDSQDRVLFRDELESPGMQERERAELLCRMAREDWNGSLDGVIRMEAGFEVILCDFEAVETVRVTRVKGREDSGKRGLGKKEGKRGGKGKGKDNPLGGAEVWFKAIASRYNGIGGHRVRVDYDWFVTAYDAGYALDLFPGAKKHLPRLDHLSNEQLEPVRADLDELVRRHQMGKGEVFDWQAIADMVVLRYGHELRYMASGQTGTLEELHREIETLLGPFIDYGEGGRDSVQETERCATQFIPAEAPDGSVAGEAVRSVARSICSTLVEAWDNHTDYEAAIGQLRQLMEYLNWTMWKECRGCGDHEICAVPIWPMGTVEDYEHPQCRDASSPSGEGRRYWGEPWGPGPKASGPDAPPSSPFSSWYQHLKRAFYG
ncbi:hypothetical protein P170DRAFT_365228 [Aspergillus steynii IBT 23096]|uniref:Uncharacterized protein n=1 Tax=Aspergillus steynii IBT 23096 TaxID=1392250 RepID=A0A2I2FYS4_9EURO|nr:uncharacterized protein P170DRAFT_365228 [Aspergillus steynii IBT 23096]PLB45791.1 hypothetical protein P170DRAFT_365228 [Aspergillus steynii IBT 23096]